MGGRLIPLVIGVLVAGAVSLGSNAVAQETATDCDKYAASETDPNAKAPAVAFDKIDPARAIQSCNAAVRQFPNSARLQFQFGRAYQKGNNVSLALEYYRKAAAQNYAPAQNSIGHMYADGQGVPADDKEAISWYRKAAEQGLAAAQNNLGIMYWYGRSVPRDDQQAAAWFGKAAKQGLPSAQSNLDAIQGSPKVGQQAAPSVAQPGPATPRGRATAATAGPAEDLINAAGRGDAAAVQALLAKGADVNAMRSGSNDATPLIMASLNGHLDVVQALIAKGADVNAKRNSNGATALMLASQFGHLDVVQALLANGADVNAKDSTGWTALMAASQDGHLDVLQALLVKGADVNVKASHGETALMVTRDTEIRALLVQAGAKPAQPEPATPPGGAAALPPETAVHRTSLATSVLEDKVIETGRAMGLGQAYVDRTEGLFLWRLWSSSGVEGCGGFLFWYMKVADGTVALVDGVLTHACQPDPAHTASGQAQRDNFKRRWLAAVGPVTVTQGTARTHQLALIPAVVRIVSQQSGEGAHRDTLPPAPAGFAWRLLAEINAAVLVPDGWFFKRTVSSRAIATIAYFVSRENIDANGAFETGLSLNVLLRPKDAEGYAKGTIAKIAGMETARVLKPAWEVSNGGFVQYGCVIRTEQKTGPLVTEYRVIVNRTTKTTYVVSFESPERAWDEAGPKGAKLLDLLLFDPSV